MYINAGVSSGLCMVWLVRDGGAGCVVQEGCSGGLGGAVISVAGRAPVLSELFRRAAGVGTHYGINVWGLVLCAFSSASRTLRPTPRCVAGLPFFLMILLGVCMVTSNTPCASTVFLFFTANSFRNKRNAAASDKRYEPRTDANRNEGIVSEKQTAGSHKRLHTRPSYWGGINACHMARDSGLHPLLQIV